MIAEKRTVAERLQRDLLEDLRADVAFAESKGRFLFALDSYDVIRFCFPRATGHQQTSIGAEADYFAALSYVLDRRAPRPLLFPEHLLELHDYVAAAQRRHVKMGFEDAAIAREIESKLTQEVDPEKTLRTTAEQVAFVGDHFSMLLYLQSAQRQQVGYGEMARLMTKRLSRLVPPDWSDESEPNLPTVLADFARLYKPDRSFVQLCTDLLQQIQPGFESSNRADARALDRLRQLNSRLGKLYAVKTLQSPWRAFLLSSSVRMLRLMRALANMLANESVRLVRVPDQIFAYVISEPQVTTLDNPDGIPASKLEASRESVLNSIDWLVGLDPEGTTLPGRATHCVEGCLLDGHVNSTCPNRTVCERFVHLERVKSEVLSPFIDRTENWALYTKLRESLRGDSHNSEVEADELIRRFVDSDAVASRSLAQLSVQRAIIRAHSALLYQGLVGIPAMKTGDIYDSPPADGVRGAQSALPWLLQSLDPAQKKLVEGLRAAFFDSPDNMQVRMTALNEIWQELVQFDTLNAASNQTELASSLWDLVRGLWFLALTDHAAEESAVDLAKIVLRVANDGVIADSLYLLVWATRRCGNTQESVDWANVGISRDPIDPRFWHGRALAKYSDVRRSPLGKVMVASVVSDFETAAARYCEWLSIEEGDRSLFRATCLNAMVFLLADNSPSKEDLSRAREALTDLKTGFKREQRWSPKFPEFFHTEALLELREAAIIPNVGAKLS
ncbi:MAG TPA: hypothetical protein VJL35_05460, partial [Gemmatimonadaceae bacterium]|nr:hypothetical protein [Gemmatimonadaceae bacterium]